MKKILMFSTAFLAVMVVMTGIAAATITSSPDEIIVNIGTNEPVTAFITFNPLSAGADRISFTITDASTGLLTNEVIGSWDNFVTSGNYKTSSTAPVVGSNNQWTFSIKDATDGDDATQIGKQYIIDYTVSKQGVVVGTLRTLGSASTVATASIPEFPTVALPVAAVIGLMLIFQHKKRKE